MKGNVMKKIKNAVLFKTHFWDSVVEKNFINVLLNSTEADIYIIIDSDDSSIIPSWVRERAVILNYTFESADKLGLAWGYQGFGGFWYNGDYHQNIFINQYGYYDFICSVEYDVYVNENIDRIFERMNNENIDVICRIQKIPNTHWSHLNGCVGYYDVDKYINKGLFCISFFSSQACKLIYKRRLEMSEEKIKNDIAAWPIGECVMIHEPILHNMKVMDLEKFCDFIDMYDWAPSYVSSQIPQNISCFIHPLAGREKYFYTNFYQKYKSIASMEDDYVVKGILDIHKINDFSFYAKALNIGLEEKYKKILFNSFKINFDNKYNIIKSENEISNYEILSCNMLEYNFDHLFLREINDDENSFQFEAQSEFKFKLQTENRNKKYLIIVSRNNFECEIKFKENENLLSFVKKSYSIDNACITKFIFEKEIQDIFVEMKSLKQMDLLSIKVINKLFDEFDLYRSNLEWEEWKETIGEFGKISCFNI
ncbi:hypothetical protein AA0313_1940 [Acetobacter indonesiensis NRIC 0313]|uniref:Uncharacterized protein n=2 Tax=Acetobacter indonesiensis TaxID=104101 RepID=A0A6N3T9J9_9PROT|nr:hypothetical protein Abin_037_005 [Acetobacter indonesiensis]GBQ58949.1 hypothetical protein AA0313_1940 [Acetobacter indonesiensis NRIC 0313]GEN04884.1 hypothetical protein AIN02nite_29090 [Acetobacter indonesiensis]